MEPEQSPEDVLIEADPSISTGFGISLGHQVRYQPKNAVVVRRRRDRIVFETGGSRTGPTWTK